MDKEIPEHDLERWVKKGKQLRAKYLLIFFDGQQHLPQYATSEDKMQAVNDKALGALKKTIELYSS